MATKTNGKELKEFWASEEPWWPKGGYVNDDYYIVNGVESGEDFELSGAEDTDQITIMSGAIFSEGDEDDKDLQATFKKWRKSLTRVSVLIEVPRDQVEALSAAVKSIGGKIVSGYK